MRCHRRRRPGGNPGGRSRFDADAFSVAPRVRRLPSGAPVCLAPDGLLLWLAALAPGPLQAAAADELALRQGSDCGGPRASLGEALEGASWRLP
jgi:hypothetical protein